jgi:superfamily I DNA/RNA helicase
LGDIGVLVTRHFETGAIIGPKVGRLPELLEELMGEPQPITPIFKGFASELKPDENSIKFMTMHSAKGLEFRHVYLVGLEHLDSEKVLKNSLSSNDLGEAALNLIGPTRAKDRLTVYYSKDNVFLKRLADRDELFQLRRYPEDYEVRGEWLS